MVPKGWKKEFLGDVAQFSQGVQVDAELQSEIKTDGLIRFLRISDYVNPNEVPRYISKPSDKYIVNKTDLSMIRYGSSGAGDLVKGLEGAIANNLFRVIPNEKLLSKDFLWFYTHQPVVKNFLFSNSTSSTMPAISFKLVSKLPLLLPPLPEQQKIAKILSTWDKAISTTERLVDNSTQQKKALMQQLLTGKKRLLDESDKRFEGEWNDNHLHEVAKIIVSPVNKKTVEGEIPVELCNYTDVYYNIRITNSLEFMKATAKQSEIDKYTLQVGDVIITKDSETPGDIAIPALVSEDLGGVVCGYHLAIIRPNQKLLEGTFLNYLFSMPETRYYFFTLANGATRFGLSIGSINNAHFSLPPLEEQQKIATVLTNADREIELLEQQLADLQQEKKALMQVLLTGKVRVAADGEVV